MCGLTSTTPNVYRQSPKHASCYGMSVTEHQEVCYVKAHRSRANVESEFVAHAEKLVCSLVCE